MTTAARLPAAQRPYVVATAALWPRLDPAPLGWPVAAPDCFDPTRRASSTMLDRLQRLDAALFGPRGMATPRWALYDCAGLTGVIAGIGLPARVLPSPLRAALDLPDRAEGLAPISMAVATPMLGDRSWLVYALGWLDGVAADLGVATAAATFELLRARRITCSAQWASPELAALGRFAPLEVLAAWLPTHDLPATCVVSFDVDGARVARALASGPSLDVGRDSAFAGPSLDVRNEDALEQLQAELEAGRRAWIAGPPEAKGGALRVPLIATGCGDGAAERRP